MKSNHPGIAQLNENGMVRFCKYGTFFIVLVLLFGMMFLMASCGSTVYMSPQGAIAANMGTLSKLGYTELHAKTPQGGSLDIRQDSFNGTEIANHIATFWGIAKTADALTARNASDNAAAVATQKSKDGTTLGLAALKKPAEVPTILAPGQTAVFAPK